MSRIQQLSHSVISRIAAGEIIERPASVIKELLENSVDAGSTRIEVDVEQGGAELIRIVDNGSGIHTDDLNLAFTAHATSKIREADDLEQVGTLGFRGEALASVGNIAQVTLQTRARDASQGSEIHCNGGVLSEARPWNGAVGTRIEVKHLFYNVPVRKKFLRTTPTEMGHVCEAFTRLSLSHPHLHLILRHNGKMVYETRGGTEDDYEEALRSRITTFFGREIGEMMYPVEVDYRDIKLKGFIADPAKERGNAKMQYVFVNNRWIRDRSIGHAIQEAYRGLLMTGRYAIAVLFLDLPKEMVDVNVHPTKSEVRFRNSQPIYHLVLSTLRNRLHQEDLTAQLQPPKNSGETISQPTLPEPDPRDVSAKDLAPWMPTPISDAHVPTSTGSPSAPMSYAPEPVTSPSPPTPRIHQESTHSVPPPVQSTETNWPKRSELPKEPIRERVLQVQDTYLVVETDEGMLVIDQHALHERVLFEEFKARIREGNLDVQRLLIPEPVELTAEQVAKTLEHQEALKELGLNVEGFGGDTVLLTSYPALLSKRSPQKILLAVVDHLMGQDRAPEREVLLNDLLSLMACHAAVRAGDRLTDEEMSELVAKRQLVDDIHHCPHGRPTALLFSRQELDRQFRRA